VTQGSTLVNLARVVFWSRSVDNIILKWNAYYMIHSGFDPPIYQPFQQSIDDDVHDSLAYGNESGYARSDLHVFLLLHQYF
jgi:hypothetical protein